MKQVVFAAGLLFVPAVAMAQPAQQMPPNIQALQQRVIQLTGESLDWQTQVITLQRQVEDLNKKCGDACKPPEPAK